MNVKFALPPRLVKAILAKHGFSGWCLEQAFVTGYNHAQRQQAPEEIRISCDTHRAYLIGYHKGQL